MVNITNEQKAKELAKLKNPQLAEFPNLSAVYEYGLECAIKMAAWKDKQFKEEKKQWIDKAANYIYTHAHVTTFSDIRLNKCSMTQFIENFKQAMKGE